MTQSESNDQGYSMLGGRMTVPGRSEVIGHRMFRCIDCGTEWSASDVGSCPSCRISKVWTCHHCGGKMEKQYLNKGPVSTRGRKALLIRMRCVNYRPFRDWFLGNHESVGDTGNMFEWVDGGQDEH